MNFIEIYVYTTSPIFISKGYTSVGDCLTKEGFQFTMMAHSGLPSLWLIYNCTLPENYEWPEYLKLKENTIGQTLLEKSRLAKDLETLERIEPLLWPDTNKNNYN
jgi:hypothetical protein